MIDDSYSLLFAGSNVESEGYVGHCTSRTERKNGAVIEGICHHYSLTTGVQMGSGIIAWLRACFLKCDYEI